MKRVDVEALVRVIETRAAEDINEGNISGISVAVAQSGRVLYKKNFGKNAPDGGDVTDRTLYRLASMTKPVTAAATMILVDII